MQSLNQFDGFPKYIDHGSGHNSDQFLSSPRGQDFYFIVQELLDKTIKTVVDETGCLQPVEVLRVGIELIKSLKDFHSLGFVHCDIKPDNIMFDQNKKPKIIDVGLACKYFSVCLNNLRNYHIRNEQNNFQGNPYWGS
jgi:serine/threonine protein kinase